MKRLLTILFICLLFGLQSQNKTERSFGLGVNISLPDKFIPELPIGPTLSYKFGNHEISSGIHLHRIRFHKHRSLFGFQSNYNYYFSKHFFAGIHFQYRQWRDTKTVSARYTRPFNSGSNLNRNRSFFNTIYLGYTRTLFTRVHWFIAAGAGYNYFETESGPDFSFYFSELGKQHKTYAIVHGKIGFSLDLWQNWRPKKVKKKKEKLEDIPWD